MSLRYIATLDAATGEEVRTSFGAIPTTNGRAKALRDYVSADAPKKAAFATSWNHVSTKLSAWSDAMHDKAVDLDNDTVEIHISDTRKACAGWAAIRWS
jgi:alpha-N-acetylglucosamine transferase